MKKHGKFLRSTGILMCACALLATMAAGCSSKDEGSSGSGTSTGGSSESSENSTVKHPVEDLGGYHFKYLSLWGDRDVRFNPIEGETASDDLYLERNNQLMKDYNFTMETITVSLDNFDSTIMSSAMAGEAVADIIYTEFSRLQLMRVAEVLVPFGGKDMPNVNLSDEKWAEAVTKATTYDNEVYGVYDGTPTGSVCFFNATLLKEKNLTSPYDLYKEDKWTWDEFLKLAKATTIDENGDGTPEIYSLGTADWATFYLETPMVYANGGDVVKFDENGKPRFAMLDNDAQEALNFMRNMYAEKLIIPTLPTNDKDAASIFAERKVAFVFHQFGFVGWIKDVMDDDYGMVPMPKGPNATDYVSMASQMQAYVSTIGNSDGYKTSLIFDLITEKLPLTGDETIDDPYYKLRTEDFRDDTAVDVYIELASKVVPGQSNGIPNLAGTILPAIQSCTKDGTTTAKSAMEGVADQAQTVIDEFFTKKES